MHPVELARLLQNLIRLGTVAEIDHAAARVRVTTGDLLTDWLPWLESRAGNTRTWNPPTIGEQVLLLAPGGELAGAVVLGAINSNANPPPWDNGDLTRWEMPDGAVIDYDHDEHHLFYSNASTVILADREMIRLTVGGVGIQIDSSGTHMIKGGVDHDGVNIGNTHVHPQDSDSGGDKQKDSGGPK